MFTKIFDNFRFTNQERELQGEIDRTILRLNIERSERARERKEYEGLITTLKEDATRANRELIQSKRHSADLGNQVEELRAGKPMSPQEWGTFKLQAQVIRDLQKQDNQLALWLRNNRKLEIERGDHSGMTLVQVIIRYLAKGLREEGRTETPNPEPTPAQIPGTLDSTELTDVEKQALQIIGTTDEEDEFGGFGGGVGKSN